MSKTDKTLSVSKNYSSHCFPVLQDAVLSKNSKEGEPSDIFEPLFGCKSANSNFSRSNTDRDKTEDHTETVKQARQKNFQCGHEAGQQDACRIAQDNLSPGLQDLIQTMSCLGEYQQQVSELTSKQILRLALVISEQILGTSSHLDMSDLDGVRACIEDSINQAYQLNLKFNPEDLKTLSGIMECEGLGWPQHTAINIQSDETFKSGALQGECIEREYTYIEEQAAKCFTEFMAKDE